MKVSVLGVSQLFSAQNLVALCVCFSRVITCVACLAVLCRSGELLEDKDLVLAVLVLLTSFAQVFPRVGLN